MSEVTVEKIRTMTWKQGTFIMLGIPILILPALCDISGTLWAFSIVLWTVAVAQAFLSNIAFGELVSIFPDTDGVPGAVNRIISPKNASKFSFKKFIAAFGAWGYWFTWTPAPAVFSILIADYLVSYFDVFAHISYTLLTVCIGVVLIGGFFLINLRGFNGGAKASVVLTLLSIIPITVVLGGTLVTGDFQFSNIENGWLPPSWSWSPIDMVMLFGCLGLAQWSATAWEGCVIFGQEYKKPESDIPKALLAGGMVCLFFYFFISTTVFGTLGVELVEEAGTATLVPIAILLFGDAGASVAILFLVAAMLLIVQTGFLGGARSMHALAMNNQMPAIFKRINKHGIPVYALLMAFIVNIMLIFVGNPVSIISASGMTYCIGIGIALIAFFISKTNPELKNIKRIWSAPRGWKWVALIMAIYELIILLPCLFYWNMISYGTTSVILSIAIILTYIPLWLVMQHYEQPLQTQSGVANMP